MKLDANFKRFAQMFEEDVGRMQQQFESRIAGYDDFSFDDERNIVTFRVGTRVAYSGQVEPFASYQPEVGLFLWAWSANAITRASARQLTVYREGTSSQIGQLTTKQLTLTGEWEARFLGQLAASLARADGSLQLLNGTESYFFGVYETRELASPRRESKFKLVRSAPDRRFDGEERPTNLSKLQTPVPANSGLPAGDNGARTSLRPPSFLTDQSTQKAIRQSLVPDPSAASNPPPATMSGRASALGTQLPSLGPPVPATPATPAKVKEPLPELFAPVVEGVTRDVNAALGSFGRALLIIKVEPNAGKARFLVQTIAQDANDEMHAIDSSPQLLEATGRFVVEDAKAGNGRWLQLVAKIDPGVYGGAAVTFKIR